MQKTNQEKIERLPCRGCTRKCKNYGRCEGKPWRLPEIKECNNT